MADTSPLSTHREGGRHRRPHETVADPPAASDAVLLDADVAERRCWRCLHLFPGDSTRAPSPAPEWWLCDPCDRVLLPAKQRAA